MSSANLFESITVLAPGDQGDAVAGMHGCGVRTPIAAAVAAATCGFDGLLHIPNGMMLVMGTKSMIVAAGIYDDSTWLTGRT